jgi:hypothetical protein
VQRRQCQTGQKKKEGKREKNVRGPVVYCGMDQEGRASVEHFQGLGNLYLGLFDKRIVSPSSSEMVIQYQQGEHTQI